MCCRRALVEATALDRCARVRGVQARRWAQWSEAQALVAQAQVAQQLGTPLPLEGAGLGLDGALEDEEAALRVMMMMSGQEGSPLDLLAAQPGGAGGKWAPPGAGRVGKTTTRAQPKQRVWPGQDDDGHDDGGLGPDDDAGG